MWKNIAQDMDLQIPDDEMEAISRLLDRLHDELRPAFDRDLSTTEPVGSFRPDGK